MVSRAPPPLDAAAAKLPWLAALRKAYAVLDAGIAQAVAATGRQPACQAGCAACCCQSIPASGLEVQGLRWFVLTQLPVRTGRLVGQALCNREDPNCPFLVDGSCAAYALRPMACREFVVFARPCTLGESPVVTRPQDVLELAAAAQRQAFALLLPHYGVTDASARERALTGRLVLSDTHLLRDLDWSGLSHALLGK